MERFIHRLNMFAFCCQRTITRDNHCILARSNVLPITSLLHYPQFLIYCHILHFGFSVTIWYTSVWVFTVRNVLCKFSEKIQRKFAAWHGRHCVNKWKQQIKNTKVIINIIIIILKYKINFEIKNCFDLQYSSFFLRKLPETDFFRLLSSVSLLRHFGGHVLVTWCSCVSAIRFQSLTQAVPNTNTSSSHTNTSNSQHRSKLWPRHSRWTVKIS